MRILDEGVQAGFPEPEGLEFQRLVACDAAVYQYTQNEVERIVKLTSPSPPRLPKVTLLPC